MLDPINYVWTEKYRPHRVSEMVGSFRDKIMKYFLSSGVKDKDVIIISKKFGLDCDGNGMTLDEIGKQEGMTKEGVRQAIKRVFKNLRNKKSMLELKKMIA